METTVKLNLTNGIGNASTMRFEELIDDSNIVAFCCDLTGAASPVTAFINVSSGAGQLNLVCISKQAGVADRVIPLTAGKVNAICLDTEPVKCGDGIAHFKLHDVSGTPITNTVPKIMMVSHVNVVNN